MSRWRRASLRVLVVAIAAMTGSVGCRTAVRTVSELPPVSTGELPPEQYAAARSVAWLDDHRLLIGTRGQGIVEYDLTTKTGHSIISGSDIPDGISDVSNLDTDGKTVVAFNHERTDIAYDVARAKLFHTRRVVPMRIMDMAVSGGNVAVLGYSFDRANPGAPLWFGKAGASWSDHQLLYDTSAANDARYRTAIAPYAGAVGFVDADTIAFITPSEVGVVQYATDGTTLARLGTDMTALAADHSKAILSTSLEEHYEQLNKVPTIDDLVILPAGPAVIVRVWSLGTVSWELWIPSANAATRRLCLGLEDTRVIGGHLRCDSYLDRLACVFGKRSEPGQPDVPQLVVFNGVERTAKACE